MVIICAYRLVLKTLCYKCSGGFLLLVVVYFIRGFDVLDFECMPHMYDKPSL